MRAETLNRIANDIIHDIENSGVEVDLPKLVEALENHIESPDEETEREIAKIRSSIRTALGNSDFNEASLSDAVVLEESGVAHLLGQRLADKIEAAFAGNDITPSLALTELKAVAEDFDKLYKAAYNLHNGFSYFEVSEDELQPGEFEFLISIPRQAVDEELGQLGREAQRLNQIVGVFSEIATGRREPAKVRAIASSDLQFILESAPAVAMLIATALERTVALYEKILGIIRIHRDMKRADVPASLTDSMQSHIDKAVKEGLEVIAKDIDKKYIAKLETERRQELKTEVRGALRDLASRLDRGYGFDVRGEDLEDAPVEEGENPPDQTSARKEVAEAFRVVEEVRPKLRYFKPDDDAILSLGPPANDDGPDERGD